MERELGGRREPGRTPSLQDRDAVDIAASASALVTECAVAMAQHAAALVPAKTLVVSGLVARMPKVIEGIRGSGAYPETLTPPWPDEAGAALGAALVGAGSGARQVAPWLGPELGPALESGEELPRGVAARVAIDRVAAGELVGWAAGRLALGCTSLGGRVALADPRDPNARARLLAALQRPEDWQEASLVRPPLNASSGLGALVAAAEEAGLPGLMVADLRVRGGVMPRAELEALETFRRTGLAALVTESSLYLNAQAHAHA